MRGNFDQAFRPQPSVVKGLPLPSVVKGVQACRLPGFKPLQPCVATSTRHSGHSPLPFAGTPLLRAFKPAVCQAQPSVLKGVQDCRLPGVKRLKPLKPRKSLKRSAAASTRDSGHSPLLLRAFKPAVCQASNPYNRAWQLRPNTQATETPC